MEGVIQFLSAAVIAGTPLLFATIGEVFTQRSGHLNLGVEGMMLMGAVSGFSAGLSSQNPIVALLAAMLGGAAGALIYAILTVTLRAEQNVTGLALTIFGTGLSAFMGKELIGQIVPEAVKAFFKPISLPVLGQIPVIGPVFFRQDAFVYLGYLVAIIGAVSYTHLNEYMRKSGSLISEYQKRLGMINLAPRNIALTMNSRDNITKRRVRKTNGE